MTRESDKLLKLINEAIADGVITGKEYHEILAQAAADGREDPEELALLQNLQEMISNGTVKRVG
jgi:Asp-tRNA(Asn)/Glu-tRNA(Gln) amidotransferase B subunit